MQQLELDMLLMTLVVFIPSVFALGLIFFPRGREEAMRWWSLCGTALTLGVSLCLFIQYKNDVIDPTKSGDSKDRKRSSLVERADLADNAKLGAPPGSHNWLGRIPWIQRFNIDYYLGMDGISLPLILLTTVLTFLAMIASWNIDKFVRGYCMLFLILETGMLGTFVALDFFLFYIFWEVMLLPMYFLIGVWGGPRREYAAIKFFLFTFLGSIFLLIALLGFNFTNVRDFVNADRIVAMAGPEQTKAYVAANDTLKKAEEDLQALEKDFPKEPDAKKRLERAKLRNAYLTAATNREKELAKLTPTVNSFDLVLLSRVGKAAMQHLKNEPVQTPHLARADLLQKQAKSVEEELKELGDAEATKATATLNELEKHRKGLQDSLKERMEKEPFFKAEYQKWWFIFLFIGFAIKVPIFPFHTWLPDAHVEAPTPISMILAGVLLKLGGYGILRVAYPICPWAAEYFAWWIALIGIVNIVYGAFAAMAQTDFKKLVAYSSVSHMGYVILGIAIWSTPETSQYWSWGMNGAMFQMIAHGITSAGMFFCVGVIYDRAHHRNLDNFRGLYEPMPLYGGISAIIFFAAMGLPGMCGFVGEFMVVLATWNFSKTFAVLAALTVVITAAYILWTIQRVYMGTNPTYKNYPDITPRELTAIVPLVVLSILFGVAPTLLLNSMGMEASVTGLIDTLVASR